MNYNQMIECDVVNGKGIGCSIFLQGCTHHCKGCFNPETWNFNDGKRFDAVAKARFLGYCKHADFVSVLGGEPFDQGDGLMLLLWDIKSVTDKPIFVWTGYKYEDLIKIKNANIKNIIGNIDYLIDGEFIEELRDPTLDLRGSSNQRIIDVKQSLKKKKVILKEF